MAYIEIDSFVSKFKHLLCAGYVASLKMDSYDGEAHVTLDAKIGKVTKLLPPAECLSRSVKSPQRPRGPAYLRRQNRRHDVVEQKCFLEKTAVVENNNNAERLVENIENNAEETVSMKSNAMVANVDESTTINAMEDPAAEKAVDNNTFNEVEENCKTQSVVNEVKNTSLDDVPVDKVEKIESSSDSMNKKEPTNNEFIEYQVDDGEHTSLNKGAVDVPTDGDFTIVYGTAVLENSLHSQVDNSHVNSIMEVIDSKDHLRRNVSKISLGRIRNFETGGSTFMHEVELVFTVNTSSLWEPARPYLWKHLGQSEWTLRDGQRLSFVRIHRK